MIIVDRAVGIDLGTTNSEIAWVPPSEREIVIYADKFGRRTVPSCVAVDARTGETVVGHSARSRRRTNDAVVESIKRKMGQATRTRLGSEELLPEEISAKILSELRARMTEYVAAHAQGGKSIRTSRAVITVPAYFDAPQIEATRRAGELAGLTVIGLLQEPTAAAIYQAWKHPNVAADGVILVYDLGGGTFDVSVLRSIGGEYQVLAIDGDNYLGGDDLDRRYAEVLRKLLCSKGYALELDPANVPGDRALFQRLVHLAQEIKESLSTTEVLHLAKHDFCGDKNGEPVSIEIDISRAEYESTVADLVESTITCVKRALERSRETAGIGLSDVDHVILVGGSTRVPLVIRRVQEELVEHSKGKHLLQDEVDTCVALGAAIQAANIGGTLLTLTTDLPANAPAGSPASAEEAPQTQAEAQVRLLGALVSDTARFRLPLRVEAAPDKAHNVALWVGDEALAQSKLPAPDTTLRLEFEVGDAPETNATLALQSALGAPLAQLPLTLYRGDLKPRPTALTRASVLAKDIGIEVVRAGKRDRRVLIARGTGLPAQVSRVFFTVDQTGSVLLRLLQNRLPIKTLAIDVPTTLPVGSPVEVTLTCDESMRIEARAEVAKQAVKALVEAPDAQKLDPAGDVEQILEQAELASRGLWGSQGDSFRREAERLSSLLREALRTDLDKVPPLTHRLRDLISEHAGGVSDAMSPPLHVFEENIDRLRRIVYRASTELVGMTRDAWEERVRDLAERARKAFEDSDATAWKRVNNELQALLETAGIEEWNRANTADPNYIERRINRALAWASELEHRLGELASSGDEAVGRARKAEAERIRGWVESGVRKTLTDETLRTGGADEANRKISDAFSELERIELAIDRLPSLGLVTDRGGS